MVQGQLDKVWSWLLERDASIWKEQSTIVQFLLYCQIKFAIVFKHHFLPLSTHFKAYLKIASKFFCAY